MLLIMFLEAHDRQSLHIIKFVFFKYLRHVLKITKLLHFSCSRFLYQVYLRTGYCAGGDESAVLGADEIQITFGGIGAIFGGFQFPLETAHAGDTLTGNSLLRKRNFNEKNGFHDSSGLSNCISPVKNGFYDTFKFFFSSFVIRSSRDVNIRDVRTELPIFTRIMQALTRSHQIKAYLLE